VHEEREVGSEGDARVRDAAHPPQDCEREHEGEQEQAEPDRPDLRQLLQVEVVRVADRELDVALPVPLLLERPGARTE
jgi:hypothetical protein